MPCTDRVVQLLTFKQIFISFKRLALVGRRYCVLSHPLNYSVKYHFEVALFTRTISVLFEPSKSNSQHSRFATLHLSVTTECHSDNFIKIPVTKSRCCRILYSVLFASIKSKKCGEEYQVYPLGTGAVELELQTKVHTKVHNRGEGPYQSLLLVESGYATTAFTFKTLLRLRFAKVRLQLYSGPGGGTELLRIILFIL